LIEGTNLGGLMDEDVDYKLLLDQNIAYFISNLGNIYDGQRSMRSVGGHLVLAEEEEKL